MELFDKDTVDRLLDIRYAKVSNKFQVFYKHKDEFDDRQYWYGLSRAYTESYNLFQYRHLVKECFCSIRPERRFLMDKYDFDYFKKLPNHVKIYRGMTIDEFKNKDFGISWTLCKQTALQFAIEFTCNPATSKSKKIVYELIVHKSKILGYHSDKNEEEIFYLDKS